MPLRRSRVAGRVLRALIAVWRALISRRAALVLAEILLTLVAAHFVLRALVPVYNLDWRIIRKLLYYQAADPSVFEAVLDPVLFFRLKPGGVVDRGRVRVNSLGFRGREHAAAKPPGVFRVVCLGGSNVYGLLLAETETWPAQLERELNEQFAGSYEVWNGGACAYVGSQMARIGEEALAKYAPDLIVIGLSNAGAPTFLDGAPVEAYFDKFPELWLKLFYADLPLLSRAKSPAGKLRLLQQERVYRFYAAALMGLKKDNWRFNPEFEIENQAAIRALVLHCRREKVGTCFFLYPGADPNWAQNYYLPDAAAVCQLTADGLPEEYGNIHPAPYVDTWYAREVARFLFDRHLLGEAQRKPADARPAPTPSPADTAGFALKGAMRTEKETTFLPAGSFMMGCSPGDSLCENDERPRHRIFLDAFRIDRAEVTNDQYRRCVDAGACPEPLLRDLLRKQPGDHPVVGVRWEQAAAYCRWRNMRLPTEAEWEFAARAGNPAAAYGALDDIAWFADNAGRATHPVAQKQPNAWGLYDMFGNVAEWCSDGYAAGYYAASPLANPRGEDGAGFRAVRGGAWFTDRRYLRASYRHAPKAATFAAIDLGFRCAQDVARAGGQ